MKKSQQSGDTTSQKDDLSLKGFGVHIEYVDGDHVSLGLLEPTPSCRTWNAMSNSKVEVTGILDQTTQSVVVLFLGVGILWHAFMIMPVSVRENSKSGIGPLATTRTRAVKSRMSWKTARWAVFACLDSSGVLRWSASYHPSVK
jgi:hypothetical protein